MHYIYREDSRLQDILLAIQTGSVLSDPNRMRMTDNTYYLRSPQEMTSIFSEVPPAISNTLLIAERCELDLGFKGYRLPDFKVPEGHTADSYLRELCEDGLGERYGTRADEPEVRERLEYELDIIHQMGFDTYFLIVWDLCKYAREKEIWYNARGSAAGSIVAYSLHITLVDPIEHGLIFERFLNPGRISMPDIDLDFRDDRRAEMLEYTAHKYGDDKVAQIITFGTLGARAAVRDVARVLDIPLTEVDRAAKLIPNIPGKPVSIEQALEEVPDFKQLYKSAEYYQELIDTAKEMEGVVRNAGTHAAGVIITDKPIIEYLPLHRPTGSSEEGPIRTVTQFEMSILDALGLLKVDFLGLATLTIMARACDLIRERHNVDLNLQNIPTDDPETYQLLGRGETAGVFQLEGSGMRRYLMQMKPKNLDNVIAMVALFRPGPMEFIPSYISRMHGDEVVTFRHPALESILEETYGITVYQEQIMYTAMKLAGYTASEADNLRKGVAKKKADVLFKHRKKFVTGAIERDIPAEVANQIFDDWEAFARYGFPKGHAADYGVIAVQTAYLKAHYPVEYMTALLSVNQNDTDKVALYVADCRRMGIDVEPPDVNASGYDFTFEDRPDGYSAIRFGLGAVKNVGHGPVEAILKAREEGSFEDINDFAHRVDLRQVGKRPLECLVRVGALDRFGSRQALLQALDRIVSVSTSHFRAVDVGQMSLFGPHTGIIEEITLPKVSRREPEVNRREQLNWERELIGLYVSDHPLNPVMDQLAQAITHFSGQLSEAASSEHVRVAGIICRIRPHQTKTGKSMGFVTLEDLQGTIDLVVFPRVWERFSEIIEFDKVVMVEGRLDNQGAEPKVLVDNITTDLQITTSLEPSPLHRRDTSTSNGNDINLGDSPDGGRAERMIEVVEEQSFELVDTHSEEAEELGISEISEPYEVEDDDDIDLPPPPSPFPPDWNLANAVMEAVADPEVSKSIADASASPGEQTSETLPSSVEEEPQDQPKVESVPLAVEISSNVQDDRSEREVSAGLPPYILPPIPPAGGDSLHMITIMLRSSGDKVRDNVRIRQIYGTLIAYPGRDRFAFQLFERGRGYLIEFPNFTTGLCPELINRLKSFIPDDHLRIDAITFQ